MLRLLGIFGTSLFLLLVVACSSGQTSAPTLEEIERDSRVVTFRTNKGFSLPCIFYSKKGEGGGDQSYSWIILECDWTAFHESQNADQ